MLKSSWNRRKQIPRSKEFPNGPLAGVETTKMKYPCVSKIRRCFKAPLREPPTITDKMFDTVLLELVIFNSLTIEKL